MVQRNIVDGPMTLCAKRSINCVESTFCSELISSFSGLLFVNHMIWPTIPVNKKRVLRKGLEDSFCYLAICRLAVN